MKLKQCYTWLVSLRVGKLTNFIYGAQKIINKKNNSLTSSSSMTFFLFGI